jgi:hypothetical protein
MYLYHLNKVLNGALLFGATEIGGNEFHRVVFAVVLQGDEEFGYVTDR